MLNSEGSSSDVVLVTWMSCGCRRSKRATMKRAKRDNEVAGAAPGRYRSPRADDGFTLVELVAAIAVMAIVMVPIMTAVIAAIGASSTARNLAQVETVLQNAADRVNRAPVGCTYLIYAQAAVQASGWDGSQATVEELHYDAAKADALVSGDWKNDACVGGARSELLVQMVRITVTSPDGSIKKTMEVIKSDV